MIEYLHGKLIEKTPTNAIVDCNGIGYFLNITVRTFEELPIVDTEVLLFMHLIHREDVMELYGFVSRRERAMFRKLIKVSQIGPRVAMGILSGAKVEELEHFIYTEDIESIMKLPGVGRKKAERLILELRGKIVEKERKETLNSDAEQAIEVLLSLGFTKKEANSRIRSVLQENKDADLETLVRKSIKY